MCKKKLTKRKRERNALARVGGKNCYFFVNWLNEFEFFHWELKIFFSFFLFRLPQISFEKIEEEIGKYEVSHQNWTVLTHDTLLQLNLAPIHTHSHPHSHSFTLLTTSLSQPHHSAMQMIAPKRVKPKQANVLIFIYLPLIMNLIVVCACVFTFYCVHIVIIRFDICNCWLSCCRFLYWM